MDKIRYRGGYPVVKDLRAIAEDIGIRLNPFDAYSYNHAISYSDNRQNDLAIDLVFKLKTLGVSIIKHVHAHNSGYINGAIFIGGRGGN